MKKIFTITTLFLCAACLSALSNKTNLTFSVTPIEKDENDDIQFGGAYFLADSTLSDDYMTLGGKLYYRLKETNSSETESQKLEIKRAYAKIRPFGNSIFEAAIGKLYSYYLTGGYFSLTETYTGASRWGKTGVGLKSEYAGFTFGAALPVSESYVTFNTDWGVNAAVEYDFSHLSENIPLSVGATLLYSATGNGSSDGSSDGDENIWSVSEKDFTECFALNFSKKNLGVFKNFSVFAAFSHNAQPYVANTILSPVANKKNADLKRTNLFSLAIRPTIGSVKITSESEIGHSVEGNMLSFHSVLQVYFPVYGVLALKPQAGYYAAYDTSDSSKSFDTWEIYPRFTVELEKWTFTVGWDMFYKEIADSDYRWLWDVPVTAKYRLGKN